MGIDRIGNKGPPAPPPPQNTGTGGVSESGRPFEVAPPSANAPAAQAAATEAPHTALEQLRAGNLDAGGYLDLKVNEATAHLATLPVPELEAIRSALRDRMASDPTLVDLVRTATGRLSDPVGDE